MLIGPGSTIGGRYRLGRPLDGPALPAGAVRWLGTDLVLDRSVGLLVLPPTGPVTAAILDAARRAAGVEEARLVRVLDVVSDPLGAAVVEETVPESTSLGTALRHAPIPAAEARRIVGEAATALAAAGARGLHHLALVPDAILVQPDGTVRVRGLAVDAALHGVDDTVAEPGRTDARRLVAVLYAAVTGRWPLAAGDAPALPTGLPAAPRYGDGVAPPSQLVAGAGELDELVARGLSTARGAGGPGSPADLAVSLGTWSPTPVVDLAHHRPGLGAGSVAPPVAVDDAPPPTAPIGPVRARPEPAQEQEQVPEQEQEQVPEQPGAAPAAAPVPSGATTATATAGTAASAATSTAASAATGPSAGPPSRPKTTPGTRPAAATAVLAGPDDPAASAEHVGLSRVLATPAQEPRPQSHVDRGGPLLPGDSSTPERPDSRIALLLVGVLVLLLGVFGYLGLPRLGDLNLDSLLSGAPAAGSATARPTTSAPGGTASGPAASAARVAIVGGASYEPGRGQVASNTAARAWDGKADTYWRSNKWYASADLGGTGTQGYGLVADLGQQTPVRRVVVTLPAAQDVKVYVATSARTDGATLVGESSGRSGALTFEVADGKTAEGTLVIVLVTRLAPDPEANGRFRAMVSELQVVK